MSKNNGGPAFPYESRGFMGMTLRDYFAAKAMQGALSGCAARGEAVDYKELAGFSYDIADAMIVEREK